VSGEVAINLLLPGYMTYTSSRIFWSFHTPYRVPSLPKPAAIAPVAPVRSLHGDRTAVPNHKGRRFEERQRRCPRMRCRYRYAHNRWYQNTSTRIYFLSWFISSQVCNKITVSFGMEWECGKILCCCCLIAETGHPLTNQLLNFQQVDEGTFA